MNCESQTDNNQMISTNNSGNMQDVVEQVI